MRGEGKDRVVKMDLGGTLGGPWVLKAFFTALVGQEKRENRGKRGEKGGEGGGGRGGSLYTWLWQVFFL
jgi:hypothetical protein